MTAVKNMVSFIIRIILIEYTIHDHPNNDNTERPDIFTRNDSANINTAVRPPSAELMALPSHRAAAAKNVLRDCGTGSAKWLVRIAVLGKFSKLPLVNSAADQVSNGSTSYRPI